MHYTLPISLTSEVSITRSRMFVSFDPRYTTWLLGYLCITSCSPIATSVLDKGRSSRQCIIAPGRVSATRRSIRRDIP